MKFSRMPIEVESPEEYGYSKVHYNLSESSCSDQTLESLGLQVPNLTLLYKEHRGSDRLRKLIVEGSTLDEDCVLTTAGAAGALFIISTSILTKEDHLVVVRPNYATNIETPRAIGCDISFIDLSFDEGFQPNVSAIEAAIKPNTKLVSMTCPHNPTGTVLRKDDLLRIVEITRKKGCLLLVDETYREISYGTQLPTAATFGDHVISVSSLSKAYGVPGIRMGWIITQRESLKTMFLAAKEQISITGSVIDEWIAEEVLSQKESILRKNCAEMARRREIIETWIKGEELLEWVKPEGGAVCFIRMKQEPQGGTSSFYSRLLTRYNTYVGPGHWFEMSDLFFRVGYGWPTQEELEKGLKSISKALRDE